MICVIIITLIINHSFTLLLQAQNLPFQQILPTLILLPPWTAFTNRTYHAFRFIFSFFFFNFCCRAMLCISAAYAVVRCLCVCVSVTFVNCVKTIKHIIILVLPRQMA